MNLTKEFLVEKGACSDGFAWFLKHESECDTVEKCVSVLLNEGKSDWAFWLISRVLTHENNVRWAVMCARKGLPIWEKEHPENLAPRKAIDAAEAWLENPCESTRENARALAAAWVSASAWAGVSAWALAVALAAAWAWAAALAAAWCAEEDAKELSAFGLSLIKENV